MVTVETIKSWIVDYGEFVIAILSLLAAIFLSIAAVVGYKLSKTLFNNDNTPRLTIMRATNDINFRDDENVIIEMRRKYYNAPILSNSEKIREFLNSRGVKDSGIWMDYDISSESKLFELFINSISKSERPVLYTDNKMSKDEEDSIKCCECWRESSVIVFKSMTVPIKKIKFTDMRVVYKNKDSETETPEPKTYKNIKPKTSYAKAISKEECVYLVVSEIHDDPKYLLCCEKSGKTNYKVLKFVMEIENMHDKKFLYEGIFEFDNDLPDYQLIWKKNKILFRLRWWAENKWYSNILPRVRKRAENKSKNAKETAVS